jgi:hypothetical protein
MLINISWGNHSVHSFWLLLLLQGFHHSTWHTKRILLLRQATIRSAQEMSAHLHTHPTDFAAPRHLFLPQEKIGGRGSGITGTTAAVFAAGRIWLDDSP